MSKPGPTLPQLPDVSKFQNADATEVFEAAKAAFNASLSPEEQSRFSQCPSSEALLDDFRKLEFVSKNTKRGLRMAKKVNSLSTALEPYFKVIEIFCGSHPEYGNLVWGALRLLLELASHFATFFEKLCEMMYTLSLSIPQYEDVLNNLKPSDCTVRLLESFVLFYKNIFEFFRAVAAVFTKKDGKIKRTPFVIADLLWTPFDARFRSVVDRMKLHQQVVREELNIVQLGSLRAAQKSTRDSLSVLKDKALDSIQMLKETKLQTLQQNRDALYASLMSWIDPPNYKSLYEETRRKKLDGTTEWLFENPKFQAWKAKSVDHPPRATRSIALGSMLWVQGNPGWGKTVLAASTVEILEECQAQMLSLDEISITAYYFFTHGPQSREPHVNAYRALAAQIFHQCQNSEQIWKIFDFRFDCGRTGQHVATENELIDILRLCLPLIQSTFLVVDGIDECNNDAQLFNDLCELSNIVGVKTILFSRPSVAKLRRSLDSASIIGFEKQSSDPDIALYLDECIAELQGAELLPSSEDSIEIRSRLLQRAEGMFLWARLMILYLESPGLSQEQRVDEVYKTTIDGVEGIDRMYQKIIDHIRSMASPSQLLARTTFKWVGYANVPITAAELRPIIWPNHAAPGQRGYQDDIEHAIIVCCAGLVENSNGELRFIHLTAKDHILSKQHLAEDGTPLVPDFQCSHLSMATECLNYLNVSVPQQPLSGDLRRAASTADLSARLPFLCYAATQWVSHVDYTLQRIVPEQTSPICQALWMFLRSHIVVMTWLEAIYTYKNDGQSLDHLVNTLKDRLVESDKQSFARLGRELVNFVDDIARLRREWRVTLLRRPHEIWNDVTAFFASPFLLKSSAVALETLQSSEDVMRTPGQRPIFSVSKDSTAWGRHYVARLSVLASPSFQHYWDDKTAVPRPSEDIAFQEVLQWASGWSAVYELFDVSGPSRSLAAVTLSLDTDEIVLAMRQSFRHMLWAKKWKFAISLSRDLRYCVILRTLFAFDVAHAGSAERMRHSRIVIAMDQIPNFRFNWFEPRSDVESYWYEWGFTPESEFLVFKEIFSSTKIRTLAVFRTSDSPAGLQASLVSQLEFSGPDIHDWHFDMNPDTQQIVFPRESGIWLWDIWKGREGLTLLQSWAIREIGANPATGLVTAISFSSCGRYVAVTGDSDAQPTVIPVGVHQKAVSRLERPSSSTEAEIAMVKTPFLPVAGDSDSPSTLLKRKSPAQGEDDAAVVSKRFQQIPQAAEDRPKVCVEANGPDGQQTAELSWLSWNSNSQVILHTSRNGEITLGDGRDRQVTLLRLPDTINPRTTAAAFSLDDADEQDRDNSSNQRIRHFKIILNEAESQSYTSDEQNVSEHLPAVVRKDVRALAQREKIEELIM